MKKIITGMLFVVALLAMPMVVEAAQNEGSPSGASMITDRVDSYDNDYHYITFYGGQRAIVAVEGDHDTDLDLTIYDENGNQVASHIDNYDNCVCSWVPNRTATYTIKIRNYGDVYNAYTLYYN